MSRQKICSTDDLAEGKRILKEIQGREIGVFNLDGEYYAVANYCVHAGGPVCEGRLTGTVTSSENQWDWDWKKEGQILSCPWHGWEFDLTDGVNLADSNYTLLTYEVEVEDGDIFVIL